MKPACKEHRWKDKANAICTHRAAGSVYMYRCLGDDCLAVKIVQERCSYVNKKTTWDTTETIAEPNNLGEEKNV